MKTQPSRVPSALVGLLGLALVGAMGVAVLAGRTVGGPAPSPGARRGRRVGPTASASKGSKSPLEQARSLYEAGRLREAERRLTSLVGAGLRTRPAQEAAVLLTRLWISQRRYHEAHVLASKLASIPQTAPKGWTLLARIDLLEHRVGRALRAVQQALALRPTPDRLRLEADCLLEYKKPRAAMAILRRALSMRPDSAELLTLLGDAAWQARRLNEAQAFYEKARNLRDGTVWPALAEDRLGTLYVALHHRGPARKLVAHCTATFPPLGCPYTEAALSPPDPTRPLRKETHVRPRGAQRPEPAGEY